MLLPTPLRHLHDVTSCLLLFQLRKRLSKRRGSHYSSKFPRQTDTEALYISLFPASPFSHRITASFLSAVSLPLHHCLLHLTISLPQTSPLSCTHFVLLLVTPQLFASLFLFPTSPCLSCSIRHQLFFPRSVLFRDD